MQNAEVHLHTHIKTLNSENLNASDLEFTSQLQVKAVNFSCKQDGCFKTHQPCYRDKL